MTVTVEHPAMAEAADQSIGLRCPRCTADIPGFDCQHCGFPLRSSKGIVHALPPERIAHYARFIEEYEKVRDAEGRGGDNAACYLNLPYNDGSGTQHAQWSIRACSFDYLQSKILRPLLGDADARILDLGAGNGWMSYRFSLAGYRPVAVDLLTNDRDGLGAAEHYRSCVPALFPRFRAEFARLPFRSQIFDAVIFNSSFHYAEDAEGAVREALRCTRPGGMVAISDTPWYSCEESGHAMVSERRAAFLSRYGTASQALASIDFLTDDRLRRMEQQLGLKWEIHTPQYGIRWALRPTIARLRKRREPATFRLYCARKA
ncbi:MAG TPA: class I SAM-dependent methyltransferase [Terracidiphilus sp.]|jgi:SAM-dependent methyltransferase|nr:class I SAM-dependent methyltransferase [Terracidiphilus sp.]